MFFYKQGTSSTWLVRFTTFCTRQNLSCYNITLDSKRGFHIFYSSFHNCKVSGELGRIQHQNNFFTSLQTESDMKDSSSKWRASHMCFFCPRREYFIHSFRFRSMSRPLMSHKQLEIWMSRCYHNSSSNLLSPPVI